MSERRNVVITGRVQGVGFREAVRQIAIRHDVAGFVRNVGWDTVEIDVEGEPAELDAFFDDVLAHPPRHAKIEDVRSASLAPVGMTDFYVAPSIRGE